MAATKICTKCKKKKSLSEFYKHKTQKDGLSSQCIICIRKYQSGYCKRRSSQDSNYYKEKYQKQKIKQSKRSKEAQFNGHLKRRYGITLEDYDKMFEQQKGLCVLCGLPEIGRRLAVDHNHQTGKIRGLLCHQCNCCIGFIENKNLSVKKIQKYLERN